MKTPTPSSSEERSKLSVYSCWTENDQQVAIADGVVQKDATSIPNDIDTLYLDPALRTAGAEPGETWRLSRVINSKPGGTLQESDERIRIVNSLDSAMSTEQLETHRKQKILQRVLMQLKQ